MTIGEALGIAAVIAWLTPPPWRFRALLLFIVGLGALVGVGG